MALLPDNFHCEAEDSLFAAVYVEYLGKPEECEEIAYARRLAAWVAQQPGGAEVLREFCTLSPMMMRSVRSIPCYEAVLDMLHVTYAAPCVAAVSEGRMEDAFAIYQRMMEAMKAQWLPENN